MNLHRLCSGRHCPRSSYSFVSPLCDAIGGGAELRTRTDKNPMRRRGRAGLDSLVVELGIYAGLMQVLCMDFVATAKTSGV